VKRPSTRAWSLGRLGAVEAVDGAVEGLVGLEEVGGHEERVVELGEGESS
jgi:hypothetical protein